MAVEALGRLKVSVGRYKAAAETLVPALESARALVRRSCQAPRCDADREPLAHAAGRCRPSSNLSRSNALTQDSTPSPSTKNPRQSGGF